MAKKQKVSLKPTSNGLPEPFPAAPYRVGKHCLYINKGERMMVQIFAADYSARKFLDILLADDELGLTKDIFGNPNTIQTSSGISVRCHDIQRLIDYEYSASEAEWELPEPYLSQALRFRSDSYHRPQPKVVSDNTDKPARVPREKKEKSPRPARDGLISIADIAEELKMEPREARGILRKAKIEKPDAGWAWSKNEVDTIKKLLQSNK